ncbi:MAG: DUF6263 family protein [Mariniblastus sp.]
MKTKTTKFALLAFALNLICQVQIANAQQDLKWQLTTGDQFTVTLVQTSDSKTNVDSRATEMNSSSTIVMDWNVTKVADNGDATIQQELVSIKVDVGDPAIPAQAVAYNTASEEKPSKTSRTLLKQVRPLIGLKFDVVMSARGEIKEVTLPQATADAIVKLPDAMKLKNLFSEKGLKDILGTSAIVLPEGNLKSGESWKEESSLVTPFGQFNRVRKYTFNGMKTVDGHELAEFTLDATMEKIEETGAAQTPESIGKLLKSAGSGILRLDVEGGYFTSSKINNEVQTERPYREKMITSVLTNEIQMRVEKK